MSDPTELQNLLAQAITKPRDLVPFVVSAAELMKKDMPPK